MRVASPTLLIISQVYDPDPAAVGQHVSDVAREMASRGWTVWVFTAARGYDAPSRRYPRSEDHDNLHIRRLPASSFGKRSIAIRLLAQLLFVLQAIVRGLFVSRLTGVLVSTSPPFAGFFGAILAGIRRVPLVWWVMDLNPDQMIAAGKLRPSSSLVSIFDWMNRLTLRQAAGVVVLDRFMAERVNAKVEVSNKLHVIPPWPQTDAIASAKGSGKGFREEHDLQDHFVIMYAGNHALQHPLNTLLDAARELEHEPRAMFVFIGGGLGKATVDERIAAGAPNILSLPYQPKARLADVLSAADLHVVSMGNDVVGIVHPSKIYGAMAVARPILFFGPPASHAGELVLQNRIGWQIGHGDVAAGVNALSEAMSMDVMAREAMGLRAAQQIRKTLSRDHLLSLVCDVVSTVNS